MKATLFLTRFKIASYVRSHRIVQPFIVLLGVLVLLYSVRVPVGGELSSYADSAALIIPVFGWAARGLLDTEPDVQRLISITAAGRPSREITSGLLGSAAVNAGLATIAILAPLLIGVSENPAFVVVASGIALHLLALVTGTALGALTSRPILPSPAVSTIALLIGYMAILLVGLAPLAWLTVPVVAWMRAASAGHLNQLLPELSLITVGWSAVALLGYTWLRRTRP